ncbi:hypothetical protein [Roseiarcus sp.]
MIPLFWLDRFEEDLSESLTPARYGPPLFWFCVWVVLSVALTNA